jgi:hypothetical protein
MRKLKSDKIQDTNKISEGYIKKLPVPLERFVSQIRNSSSHVSPNHVTQKI